MNTSKWTKVAKEIIKIIVFIALVVVIAMCLHSITSPFSTVYTTMWEGVLTKMMIIALGIAAGILFSVDATTYKTPKIIFGVLMTLSVLDILSFYIPIYRVLYYIHFVNAPYVIIRCSEFVFGILLCMMIKKCVGRRIMKKDSFKNDELVK